MFFFFATLLVTEGKIFFFFGEEGDAFTFRTTDCRFFKEVFFMALGFFEEGILNEDWLSVFVNL